MASRDTFFRSSGMSLIQIFIANEIGREIVGALGEVGQLQFRDLRYFYSQVEHASIPIRPSSDFGDTSAAPLASEIDELAEKSENLEQQIVSLNDSYEALKKQEIDLIQWPPLLRDMEQHAFHTADGDSQGQRRFTGLGVGFVTGVIPRECLGILERTLWRTLRGNLYMKHSEFREILPDPTRKVQTHKNVFLIFAHGKNVLAKIRKISESLGASLYGVDEDNELREDQIQEVNKRLDEVSSVLCNTERRLISELSQVAQSLTNWMVIVKKEKAVYDILNKFSYDHCEARKVLIAEAWCPTDTLARIKSTLQDVDDRVQISMPTVLNEVQTNRTPPTYVRTNKFTEAFQTIVNAYRIPKYSEINPGFYMVVTFPFLFAVMFGDFGHGALVTMVSAAMIFWEQKLQRTKLDELSYMAFYGRYIMLMMGLFSMYTGLIYNDIFSRPLTIFSSQWQWPEDIEAGKIIEASLKDGHRYPMTYALCLQYVNGRQFKSKVDIWGNFFPAMLFYQSIFGYLVITVIYKCRYTFVGSTTVPAILGYRSLSELSDAPALEDDRDIDDGPGRARDGMVGEGDTMVVIGQDDSGYHNQEGFDFFDTMIHQVIHTIEFCLNCISYTASYLRLWALLLAYQQLSVVLWNMTLRAAFAEDGHTIRVIMIVINYYLWFTLSVCILCVMEGTSAMLHSMRLHWIEAMSKHFAGEGTPFLPFSFSTVLAGDPVN
ncbi:hypothetical protein N7501_007259 [Penicillium viridicatum]|nr:hypothetical protein N7501_007259 [Penicillium viridicatum]